VLVIFAYLAPAIVPTAAIIAMLEAVADWHWHLLISIPVLTCLAAVIFYRTTSSAIYVRALALMNLGLAVDLALGVFDPKLERDIIDFPVPLAVLLPLIWCLLMYFWQELEPSFRSVMRAVVVSICKTFVAGLTLILPLAFSIPLLIELKSNRALDAQDTVQVIQSLQVATPFYHLNERKFMRHLIKTRYLWYDAERLSAARNSASVESLLEAVRVPQDHWSYIGSVADYSAHYYGQKQGLGIVELRLGADGHTVLMIDPASQAARAGLQRGDKIVSINGVHVNNLVAQGGSKKKLSNVATLEVVRKNFQIETLEITRGAYTAYQVGNPKVLEVAGSKVGYLPYHAFSSLATEQLKDVIWVFSDASLSDFILDLRYNPGGNEVDIGLLAGMLAPNAAINKLAMTATRRGKHKTEDHELLIATNQPRPVASPKRLFVITSEKSCSASEALIMALRPYMPVITIGSITCGKPVGSTSVHFGDKAYGLISLDVKNSLGEGGYTKGLKPTCEAADDARSNLGDPREASLAEALFYIEHGRCSHEAR
jgi:carboxyl-terminal processing protease